MAATSAAVLDIKLAIETSSLPVEQSNITCILPESKITVENLATEPNVFCLKLDFSKLGATDIEHLMSFIQKIPNRYQCVDLSGCNLEIDPELIETIVDRLSFMNLQKIKFSAHSAHPAPYTLSSVQQELLLKEQQLNADILAEKKLTDFTRTPGGKNIIDLIPKHIKKLKFFARVNNGSAFLSPWQRPNAMAAVNFGSPISVLHDLYEDFKKLIQRYFGKDFGGHFRDSHESYLAIFNGPKGLFQQCDAEFKKAKEKRMPRSMHIYYRLEAITWFAMMLVHTSKSLTQERAADYSGLMEDILESSERPLKTKLLQLFYANFSRPWGLQNLGDFLLGAKERRKAIALLLCELCQGSTHKAAWLESTNSKIEIVDFFNNKIYREGNLNRIISKVLIKFVRITKISKENKLLLILHCQTILKQKPNDKALHYKIWSLLYSLLSAKLNPEIESFINDPENIEEESYWPFPKKLKDNILEPLYWQFLKKCVGLSDADKKQYEEQFKDGNHHLILAFRQNFGEKTDDMKVEFDACIRAYLKKGQEGFRELRYDETRNSHLKTVFSGNKQEKAADKKTQSEENIKDLWCLGDAEIILAEGKFKDYHLSCTDDFWQMLTWGVGINCLDPIKGSYKLLTLLLYGQHRLLLLRDPKGKVVAGCLAHLLLINLKSPEPCLAMGILYHKDRYRDESETARAINEEIMVLFKRLTSTMATRLGVSNYFLRQMEGIQTAKDQQSYNSNHPDRIRDGLAVFTKKGPIINEAFTSGLDNDFINCDKLEHAEHGVCAVLYAYQKIDASIGFEITMPITEKKPKVEVLLRNSFDNNKEPMASLVLEYLADGITPETRAGDSLHFEWQRSTHKNLKAATAATETLKPKT